jgi:hypothetical protein
MRGRSVAAALVGVAAAAAAAVFRFRRRRRDTIELHYGDGSMVALEPGTPAAERLLALARTAVVAARPA